MRGLEETAATFFRCTTALNYEIVTPETGGTLCYVEAENHSLLRDFLSQFLRKREGNVLHWIAYASAPAIQARVFPRGFGYDSEIYFSLVAANSLGERNYDPEVRGVERFFSSSYLCDSRGTNFGIEKVADGTFLIESIDASLTGEAARRLHHRLPNTIPSGINMYLPYSAPLR
jgi:hypothetical protein